MRQPIWAALAAALISLLTPESRACSAFASQSPSHRLFAKSYDWYMSHGLAIINKRNVKKTSLVLPGDSPVTWVSKYGSLTYTNFGNDFPVSGLNEKGLAIEILWDYDSSGPAERGQLPAVNEVQWIQYQLDLSANVAEAVKNSQAVRMKKLHADIHYLVCDAQGGCVTFEFNNGEMQIHNANQSPVLTNSAYTSSMAYLKDYTGFGGQKAVPYGSYNSKDRFVILNAELGELNARRSLADAVQFSFQMLRMVRKAGYSVWNKVHDLDNRVSYFRRMFEEDVTRVIDLKRFNFSCKQSSQVLDIESEDGGDTSAEFKDYDPALNRATAELAGRSLNMKKEIIEAVARYPETTTCLE